MTKTTLFPLSRLRERAGVRAWAASAALLTTLALPATAQTPPQLDRLQRADGAHVVPDRFLRRWDPVTILFDTARGPADGGPEDAPGRLVTLAPDKPGAWTWLGPKTLQFRPTEPWEPLRRETITLDGAPTTLVPLLPVPSAAGPSDDANGTTDLDTIGLAFDQPVDLAALARLLTIELRPQSSTGAQPTQVLTSADFDLRPVERKAPGAKQTILVALGQPLPDGQLATLRLRLSDEPGLDDPIYDLPLKSALPFKLSDAYCGEGYDHTSIDGLVRCDPGQPIRPRSVTVQFTAMPETLDIVHARDILRITPPLDDMTVASAGENELRITGKFAADQVYSVAIAPGALHDTRGRPLSAPVNQRFSFTPGSPALAWDVPAGIVERLGPQMVPLRGHGYDHADIRIHPIDPLSRDFWPFPRAGITTRDDAPPPLPGNEPPHYENASPISGDEMAARIAALGSPASSELLPLPIHRGGVDAKFGLDLAPTLARIAGPRTPGAYLVGLRAVDGAIRQWARLQVTDLSLTTVEEAGRVRFVVTSLATTQPVPGAEIRLEGTRNGEFQTLVRGVTGPDGAWTFAAPIAMGLDRTESALRRIVVVKATDTLVLDPRRGPQQYSTEQWSKPETPWLDWITAQDLSDRKPAEQTLCHVFTERPIYRPEEKILIAGMIRRYQAGSLNYATGTGQVKITGPGEQEWQLPVTLDEIGGFHVTFDEKTEATGDYAIQYVPKDADGCGAVTVKKEAYRLPTFEVVLNAPQHAPLDAPFSIDLLARFFAGGTLSDRPLTWRVTQFPYVWTPPGRDGFLFSSDSRFSGDSTFRSTPVLSRDAKTDAGGSAQLTLDPTIEPTAQPRQYMVEATVTGDDDLQVRGVQRITALPPFVLGVKVPRYLPQVGAITPEVLALDGDGKPVTGLAMTVKLIHRQWNSVLQASDFAQGSAKYQTQVIDDTIAERQVSSAADPQPVAFGAPEAGVYLVEVTAADKVGRTQTVRVDLFMAGDTPVTWQRPPAETVTVTSDKEKYNPGETATLILQSPFQTARALAIVEEPEGRFRYDWIDIANGFGRYTVPLRKQQVPRLAVHFLLMRGRLPTPPGPMAPFDQGKPVTLAATKWVTVNPTDNTVKVSFDAPPEARPQQEFDLVLHLADASGRPLAGEATVWMVDQAVLALAKEQPLDPLPAFIVDRPTTMAARDTRSMAFGILPLIEAPGGDEAGDFGMENISVRKNFTPVPLYVPRVKVGPDGTARVHVHLPDSLTVFMLRAKAVSGPDRFGFGAGQLKVRQPVVAQPALPRFVRPGDTFTAGLIGRIVEGPGGAGRAAISLDNLTVQGGNERPVTWDGQRPARTDFTVSVPDPGPTTTTARIRFLLQRTADRASDAVQIDLPIRPDRPVVHRRDLLATGPGGALDIPALPDAARPATYARTIILATDPAVVKIIAGAGSLTRPAVGGAEQRMALAQAELALLPFTPLLEAAGLKDRLSADVAAALAAIKQSTDDNGLVAFFPHTDGSVWLTASAYRVMAAAARLGLPVDKPAMDALAKILTAALRSDYPHLLSGEEFYERVVALTALADGGQISADYAGELARRAPVLRTGGLADVASVLARLPNGDSRLLAATLDQLWRRVNLLARDGKPVYAGLTDTGGSPLILPSETRSLAEVTQAVASATPDDPRLDVLRTGLLGLGNGQGWGNTNATAAALRALAAAWRNPPTPIPATITLPAGPTRGTLDATHPLLQAATTTPGPVHIQAAPALAVLAGTDYVPTEPGAAAHADQHGFVLTRTLFRVPPTQGATQPPMAMLEPGPDGAIHLAPGDVVEELDEVISPEDRNQIALRLPMPAGLEPLNPALATATADAAPSAPPTLAPSWASYGDDEVVAVWLTLPRGTYALRTRMRATVTGSFTQPPAQAEMLYQPSVNAATNGQRVIIAP